MRKETRFQFNKYLSRIAELNGIEASDLDKNSLSSRRSLRPCLTKFSSRPAS